MTDKGDAALERIATALEQMALDRSEAVHGPSGPEMPPWPTAPGVVPTVTLPPVSSPFQFTATAPVTACPVHHQPWKTVPAGVSKRTGQSYSAFQACPERDCNQRPA